jgi:hypothetical protein
MLLRASFRSVVGVDLLDDGAVPSDCIDLGSGCVVRREDRRADV